MTDKRQEVYEIINEEREYQDKVWGGPAHDIGHSLSDWVVYIRKYVNQAENALYTGDEKAILCAIRKITALGVAVMEINKTPKRSEENGN